MSQKKAITLIPGDGIGPEVIGAARRIIDAAGAQVEWEICEAGATAFKKGIASGVPQETLDSIQRNKIALKGPLETPVGFGEKSANVTLRKIFETYGNIRPIREFPGVPTSYQGRGIDCVIVRENVEDLYAGIEHMQTPSVAQALKIISRKGCEKIVRLAFEFAVAEGRRKVHCATKANIMKLTEGMMKRAFEDIAPEYPQLEAHHIIVDNCAHQMVRFPEKFDVIVTTNMNGDILSDMASAFIGGLGFAPGANIGDKISIFEAVHGSAPKYAGKNTINPTAVLLSGVMLLRHIREFEAAESIENALFVTLENRVFTRDVAGNEGAVTTTAFTEEIIKNLGQCSQNWKKRPYQPLKIHPTPLDLDTVKERQLVGVDVFIESCFAPDLIGKDLEKLCSLSPFSLKFIDNRGVVVYPSAGILPDLVDCFRCRFLAEKEIEDKDILALLAQITQEYTWTHVEKLSLFDGQPSYTKSQGES